MRSRALWVALAVHVMVLFFAMPASPWEFDEPLFFQALHDYDPRAHHPPPPGYPVFILFAQLVRFVIPSDFATLVTISVAASVIGFVMLALAFRNLAGDMNIGVIGASLFYFSPAMLIHSTLPISEPGALALLATALYFATKPSAALFALFAALAIGWRMQFSIFVLPLFLVTVALMRGWRNRAIALIVFTLVCVVWLTPLSAAVGGVGDLIEFETGQGKYVAAQDARESRTGWTPARLAFRFIGRAWGMELTALVVLLVAATGLVFTRTIWRAVLPLAVAAATYIAVALLVMDPADGVRYSIPFVLATAFVAGVGATEIARRLSVSPYIGPAVAAAAFLLYVGPILVDRRFSISPPVRAARYAREAMPANAVALYELSLWPHATYYLRDRNPHRVDEGLAKFYDRPDVPLFIYADGATKQPDARVFRWNDSDAYRKLTRNHYRVASIIPVPPERRFRAVSGVHAPEREQDGLEWRWLSSPAEIQLPRGPARRLTLRLGLAPAAPLAGNTITLSVNGTASTLRVERGKPGEVTIDVPAGAPVVRIDAAQTFIPADVPSMRSGDRRRLAVELYDLGTSPAAAPAPPRPAQ